MKPAQRLASSRFVQILTGSVLLSFLPISASVANQIKSPVSAAQSASQTQVATSTTPFSPTTTTSNTKPGSTQNSPASSQTNTLVAAPQAIQPTTNIQDSLSQRQIRSPITPASPTPAPAPSQQSPASYLTQTATPTQSLTTQHAQVGQPNQAIANNKTASANTSSNTKPIIANFSPAVNSIQNISQAIAAAKSNQSSVDVLFPTEVPTPSQGMQYYAGSDNDANQYGVSYRIYVDTTPQCKGVHVCNIGEVNARKGGQPEFFFNRNNERLTEPVSLTRGIQGFYTPSHAMADTWPTIISWEQNDVLYSITWSKLNKTEERATIMAMANSAIKAGAR